MEAIDHDWPHQLTNSKSLMESIYLTRINFVLSEVEESSQPIQQTHTGGKKKKFERLFARHAGDDQVVDGRELKKILNNGLKAGRVNCNHKLALTMTSKVCSK